jgi:phosphate acyltransferase
MDITVAIDCMGGDHGPRVTVPAALELLRRHADVSVVLVGQREALDAELASRGPLGGARLRVRHAAEVVSERRQYGRADGDLALRPQDFARN